MYSSTQIIAAVSVAVLVIAVGYQWGRARNQEVRGVIKIGTPSAGAYAYPLPENDSDGDGVPDWLEALDARAPTQSADELFETYNTNAATDRLGEDFITGYLALSQGGPVDQEAGARFAERLAESVYARTAFEPFTEDGLNTSNDDSYEGMIAYRDVMQDVLEPFLGLQDPEFVIFARYIEGNDPAALASLADSARTYKAAGEALMEVTVPRGAVTAHIHATNALAFYGVVLEDLVRFAHDPIASFALLRTMSEAEAQVYLSFNELSTYYTEVYQSRYGTQ